MEENTEEKFINLTIKLSGNTFKIRVDANSTSLEEFKGNLYDMIFTELTCFSWNYSTVLIFLDILSVKISVPSENISLILNGRSLVHEELTLVELGIHDITMLCVS